MARREKEQPESEPDWSPDDSLLIRSAESLGRVIGSLQRELDKAATKLFKADGAVPGDGKGPSVRKRVKRTPARAATRAAKAKAAARTSSARKTGARKATAKKK